MYPKAILVVMMVLGCWAPVAQAQPRVTMSVAVMYLPPNKAIQKATGALVYNGVPRNGGVYDNPAVARARVMEISTRHPSYRVWVQLTPKVR